MGREGGRSRRPDLIVESSLQNDVKYFKILSFLFALIPPLSAQVYMGLYSTNLNIPWGKYICSFPNVQSPYNIDAIFLARFTFAVGFAVDDPVT